MKEILLSDTVPRKNVEELCVERLCKIRKLNVLTVKLRFVSNVKRYGMAVGLAVRIIGTNKTLTGRRELI